jgi:hypothetical protein
VLYGGGGAVVNAKGNTVYLFLFHALVHLSVFKEVPAACIFQCPCLLIKSD